MAEAYPLHWPEGRPRTKVRADSRFDTGFARARDRLIRELDRLGARDEVLSTNAELRLDGLPRANCFVSDPGAAVYFTMDGRQMAFACDKWSKLGDNIHAIAKTIEALRGIARWGSGDMMAAAFSGFEALPSPEFDWTKVLGVDRTASVEEINRAYRQRAKELGPNTNPAMEAAHKELNLARDAARKARAS